MFSHGTACFQKRVFAIYMTSTKRDKLFKMAQKMQTYDENENHKRSPISNTGIPNEYHRNTKIMGCVLLTSNAMTFYLDFNVAVCGKDFYLQFESSCIR